MAVQDMKWGNHVKNPFLFGIFVTYTFFSIEKTIQPLFIFSTLPLSFFAFWFFFGWFVRLFFKFSRGLSSYSIGFSPPLLSPVMAQMS